jgi:hypothetical protein
VKKEKVEDEKPIALNEISLQTKSVGKPMKYLWIEPSHLSTDVGTTPITICITDEAGRGNNDLLENLRIIYKFKTENDENVNHISEITTRESDGTMSEQCIALRPSTKLANGWYKIIFGPELETLVDPETTNIKINKFAGNYESWFYIGSNTIINKVRLVWKEEKNSYFLQIVFSEPISISENSNEIIINGISGSNICLLYNGPYSTDDPGEMFFSEDIQTEIQYKCSYDVLNGFTIFINPALSGISGRTISNNPVSNLDPSSNIIIDSSSMSFINNVAVWY